MTNYEELARIRVNEAIQEGLASQRALRSRSKKSKPIIKTVIQIIAQAFGSIQDKSKISQSNVSDLSAKLVKR